MGGGISVKRKEMRGEEGGEEEERRRRGGGEEGEKSRGVKREGRVGGKGDEKGGGSGLILTYNPTSFDLGDLSNSRSHSSSCPIYHQGLPLLRTTQLQETKVGCRTEGEEFWSRVHQYRVHGCYYPPDYCDLQ